MTTAFGFSLLTNSAASRIISDVMHQNQLKVCAMMARRYCATHHINTPTHHHTLRTMKATMTPLVLILLLLLPASIAFLAKPASLGRRNHAPSPLLSQPPDDTYYNEDEYYEQQGQQYYDQHPPPEQQYYDEQPPQQQYYDEQEPQEQQGLYLGNDVEEQMRSLQSKFPTSEADYLAAARKRAQEARASINNEASDEDWKEVAQSSMTSDDGWESSIAEAGNEESESQILIPKMPSEFLEEGDDGEEEEPTLLL